MIKIVLRSILISIVIGFCFALVASLFLPSYTIWNTQEGTSSLYGIEALKVVANEEGVIAAVSWVTAYFIAFFIPSFLSSCWQGIWTGKK